MICSAKYEVDSSENVDIVKQFTNKQTSIASKWSGVPYLQIFISIGVIVTYQNKRSPVKHLDIICQFKLNVTSDTNSLMNIQDSP